MVALRVQRDVAERLVRLAGALEDLEFGPDTAAWSAERDRLAGVIRSYLIPRAQDPSAPMTVVLAGPTGSGKSTVLNSLSGLDVSRTGALRPTTRSPVALTRSDTADRYRAIGDVSCDVVTGEARILDSLVLVDAPDLDSTSTGHRAMAETLIDNADIVVFITSALRYADEVPWQVLRRAVSRGTPVINVLNRVGSPSAGAIVDFKSRLATGGLGDELVTMPEHHMAPGAQQLPEPSVRSLRKRLLDIVSNRDQFLRDVFDRVLRSTLAQATEIARSMADLSDEMDDFAGELSVNLADRAAILELDGIGQTLVPPPPPDPTRRSLRGWRRRFGRVDAEAIEAAEERVVDRVVSVVHSDMRRWLVVEHQSLRDWNVEPGEVIADVLDSARSGVEGWVSFVARIAADHDERDVWLGEATLIEAVMSREDLAALGRLFGDDGPALVDRADRELRGRLEAVYALAGDLVVEAIRRRCGDLDDGELRACIGELSSALAPAHA